MPVNSRSARRAQPARYALPLCLLLALSALLGTALAGCGGGSSIKGTVNLAYAGSLVNLVEHTLGPRFQQASGYTLQGTPAGSTALANQIKSKLIHPDVFISAADAAYSSLEGSANGNLVRWSMNFAATQMVIGYNPQSAFAAKFQAAAAGTSGAAPWYTVLESPGIRIGRTDPALDPKGVNTILLMQLAQIYYQQSGLQQRILGADENAAQIFPEETLVARMTAGQLDAGFFYLNEVKDAGLPYITLPAQINLGDPSQASYYAQASYTSAQGQKQTGKPILYSLTIPATVRDQAGAVAFVQYLFGTQGKSILSADGIAPISITFSGDTSAVPTGLSQYTSGT